MGEDPEGRLGRPLGEALLEPTVIYVKPIVELLRSEVDIRGLAHITSGGVNNLLRLAAPVGYEIDAPLPVPPLFALIAERGNVPDEEMHEVFNMGCGFALVVPELDESRALELLRAHYPSGGPHRPGHRRQPATSPARGVAKGAGEGRDRAELAALGVRGPLSSRWGFHFRGLRSRGSPGGRTSPRPRGRGAVPR